MAAKQGLTPTKNPPKMHAKALPHIDANAVAAEQNVKPIDNPEDLYAEFLARGGNSRPIDPGRPPMATGGQQTGK